MNIYFRFTFILFIRYGKAKAELKVREGTVSPVGDRLRRARQDERDTAGASVLGRTPPTRPTFHGGSTYPSSPPRGAGAAHVGSGSAA